MKLTKTQRWVLNYLKEYPGDWVSPTDIGYAYGVYRNGKDHWMSGYHSAWGSPRCLALTEMGLIQRSGKGWYRVAS